MATIISYLNGLLINSTFTILL